MQTEKIFDRVEKKYLITKKQQEKILREVKLRMDDDSYHVSEVMNIYFDTNNYDLIIQSIDQPLFKHKFRARSYGGYDRVFLEMKTKLRRYDYDVDYRLGESKNDREYDFFPLDDNIGYKRRVMITKKDYAEWIAHRTNLAELSQRSVEKPSDLQVAREIDYFVKHFDLRPRIVVIYDRESYKDKNGLRITFDTNLTYRTDDLDFKRTKHDLSYFKGERCVIMEIKSHAGLPLWLVHMMSDEHIYPQQFSKVGFVYAKIINNQGKEKYVQ